MAERFCPLVLDMYFAIRFFGNARALRQEPCKWQKSRVAKQAPSSG